VRATVHNRTDQASRFPRSRSEGGSPRAIESPIGVIRANPGADGWPAYALDDLGELKVHLSHR